MKTSKRKLAMSITIALISVLTISIGATAIRNTKSTHAKYYSRPATEAEQHVQTPEMAQYNGELVPVIQLPELTVSSKPAEKTGEKK